MKRIRPLKARAAWLSLALLAASGGGRPATSEPGAPMTVASPELALSLGQMTAQARERLSGFKPVWDAKRKRTVCGKLGADGLPILGKNGKVLTGYNRMTAEELLETKYGVCARLPAGSTGLRFEDLRGADLRYADFVNVSLCGARLEGARLEGADLRASDIVHAHLEGAVFDQHTRLPAQASGMTDWPLKMVRVRSR